MASVKKILFVTGGAGFIGSEFVRQMCRDGLYRVHVLDSLTYAGDLARLEEVKGKFVFHKVNIVNQSAVQALFKKIKPCRVVHFAAETHVDRSILYARTAVQTNMLGTQVLLEASRQNGIERFVYISTDEVYGEIAKGQFFEKTSMNPSSPYSAGKAAGDMLTAAYVRTYRFPGMIVRPSNNYGPWQYPEKLIPVVIYKALRGQRVPVYGQGLNVREWLHVSDCARAVARVLQKGEAGEAYNVGSGQERQNITVVKTLMDLLGRPHSLIEFVQDRPGHDLRYSTNFDKIREQLGWKPEVDFESGMKDVVRFYLSRARWLSNKVRGVQAFWKQVYRS